MLKTLTVLLCDVKTYFLVASYTVLWTVFDSFGNPESLSPNGSGYDNGVWQCFTLCRVQCHVYTYACILMFVES